MVVNFQLIFTSGSVLPPIPNRIKQACRKEAGALPTIIVPCTPYKSPQIGCKRYRVFKFFLREAQIPPSTLSPERL